MAILELAVRRLAVPIGLALAVAALPVDARSPAENVERVFAYRLRGEVRPFLIWLGRDDVGGGYITLRRTCSSPLRWRDEIEVLFGSEPERIPGRVSRWGYGLEAAVWMRDSVAASPALAETEFQGIMRHSKEASLKDVVPESRNKDARPYDVTRSVVLPGRASHEFRFFSDAEDFYYRHPERLLARFRNCLANDPPLRRTALNGGPYGEPYGFLTALSAILAGLPETAPRPREPVRIARPSAVFVFNAKLYHLNVAGSHVAPSFKMKYGGLHVADVLVLNFQCLNTYKHTRTDFSLWTPVTGRLRGVPIRILLQPRWWLRLQLDLDLGAGSAAAALEDCISVSGGTSR